MASHAPTHAQRLGHGMHTHLTDPAPLRITLPHHPQLLGWPIQLLGLLALPVAVVRYGLDGKDWSADAGDAVVS